MIDELEPLSRTGGADPRNPPNEIVQVSIAISLKRIADAISRDNLGLAEWISREYANQDLSHVDFRVEGKRRADKILGDAP
jgi:hypothetical protein